MTKKEPVSKKAKIDLEELADRAWQHYRDYLDSCCNAEQGNEQGDIDELLEVIELLQPHVHIPSNNQNKGINIAQDLRTKESLLPVLLSVAFYFLADHAIGVFLQDKSQSHHEIQQHFEKALAYFPHNSNAWSMGANFGRMTKQLTPGAVTVWYERAAADAVRVRSGAIRLLEEEDASIVNVGVKEWIELLLLNQIAGVELDGDDDEEDEDEEEEEQEQEEPMEWSSSTVESTSRFMAAMLLSTAGEHDRAVKHLKEFPLTHRLHPNVWRGKSDDKQVSSKTKNPVSFQSPNGLLPDDLYQRLLKVFHPDAAYWQESGYDSRGYYSYFIDRQPVGQAPSNLLEDVLGNHLLPLAYKQMGKEAASEIVGYEIWTHTRPIEANLGHNLHFDTDESLLAQEGKITHPVLSSVLYLTGGKHGGATIVLDQDPDSELDAEQCWRSVPADNSFLVFPGQLLHGVLPCPGKSFAAGIPAAGAKPNVADLWKDHQAEASGNTQLDNRLTFMVGFWTRRVPDKMKKQKLYGPCGPIPPCTDEHTWVQEISKGYNSNNANNEAAAASSQQQQNVQVVEIPKTTPAWEQFHSDRPTDDPPLMIPRAIDHRFFVHSGSMCFRESLFERDEFDQDSGDEEEEEES